MVDGRRWFVVYLALNRSGCIDLVVSHMKRISIHVYFDAIVEIPEGLGIIGPIGLMGHPLLLHGTHLTAWFFCTSRKSMGDGCIGVGLIDHVEAHADAAIACGFLAGSGSQASPMQQAGTPQDFNRLNNPQPLRYFNNGVEVDMDGNPLHTNDTINAPAQTNNTTNINNTINSTALVQGNVNKAPSPPFDGTPPRRTESTSPA